MVSVLYRIREKAIVKIVVYKIVLILSLSSLVFAGCADVSVDEMQTVQEECFVETGEDVGQEDLGMTEAGINGADQVIIAGADKKETGKEHTEEKELQEMERLPVPENRGVYSSLVRKVWIEDRPERQFNDTFEFIITRIEAEKIEGVIVLEDDIASCYWSNSKKTQQQCRPFQGTIQANKAVCVFQDEGYPAEVELLFLEGYRIEAEVRCDGLDIDMKRKFRPYNMTDNIDWLKDNLTSTSVMLDSLGEVNLVCATTIEPHSIPWFYLTDDDGNILYEECCSRGINGGIVVWDIFIEDIDQDGRLDIWTVVCEDEPARPPEAGRIVCRFYQAENGYFYEERDFGEDLPEEYHGVYWIKRFIPAAEYEETGGNILTQQEAEEMQEKEFVIQAESFVSYDSERRIGTRDDREPVQEISMVKEYQYPTMYIWRPVDPDTLLRGFQPDDRLRGAVGEAYYDKINGMFTNVYLGWQQFYTLDGGEELIMHSMLTGQDFILEKKSVGE